MRFLIPLFFSLAPLTAQTTVEIIGRADALDAKGEHQQALEILLPGDKNDPGNVEILHRISRQYIALMRTASEAEKEPLAHKALATAQEAVQANGKNSQAHLNLAVVYGRIALFEPARRKVELSRLIREEAETAAMLDPRNDLAWHVLGRWNYELANFNPVLKSLAQTIYGKFPDASNEKAAECFRKAIAAAPHRMIHHVEYGRTLILLGRKEEARKELEKGLSLPAKTQDDEDAKQRAREALKTLP